VSTVVGAGRLRLADRVSSERQSECREHGSHLSHL
jgi:hypothetical protein